MIFCSSRCLLENGKIWADIQYLNDKGVFNSDIPLTNPATGQSLAGVINPHDGTLVTPSVDNVMLRILTLNGPTTLDRSLEDGIHPNVFNATTGIDLDLDDKTKLSDKFGIVDGQVNIDYVLNGSYVTGGASGFSAQVRISQFLVNRSAFCVDRSERLMMTPYGATTRPKRRNSGFQVLRV